MRILLAAVMAGAMLVGCNEQSAGPERGVTTRDVEEADGPFMRGLLGTKVTVSGEVSAIHHARAFEIAGDDVGGEGILIVVGNLDTLRSVAVNEGEVFRITGEVQRLVVVDVEREYDIDFRPEFEAEVEDGGPMIVAESIEPVRREGETSPAPDGSPRATANPRGTATPRTTPTP